jgi:putative ABC transport system permease protein
MAGTLARENASRSPRRTATTASSLMIGVGLVVMITVFAASARASLSDNIDTAMKAGSIVETQFGMGGMSPTVAHRIDALPETQAVTPLRFASVTVGGAAKDVTALDPATVDDTIHMDVHAGSVSHLGAHDVALQADEAKHRGVHVGDTITLAFPETGPQRMRVAAEFGTKQPLAPYVISLAAYDANSVTHVDDVVLVASAPGVSTPAVHAAIDRVLRDYPNAEVLSRDEFKGEVAKQINAILNLVYVLLAMALVIAFFGIANTLALSVFERTRELGLLRAVGMGRRQLRSTVRFESVLIALLGTVLGAAIGLGFSAALVSALHDQGIRRLAVPIAQLAVIGGVAALAALVAAALPARRAARLDVLQAIGS